MENIELPFSQRKESASVKDNEEQIDRLESKVGNFDDGTRFPLRGLQESRS